jgi:hypothetical protein
MRSVSKSLSESKAGLGLDAALGRSGSGISKRGGGT